MPALGSGVLRMGQGIAGQAALRRSVLVIEDYPSWPHAVPGAVESGLRSALAIPLVVADRVIGVLAARFTVPQAFTGEHELVLSLLAAQVAPALEAVRLHAAQTRLLDRERALREVSRALASDLDETRVLDLAVRHAARLLDAPYARVWLLDETGEFFTLAAAEGFVSAAEGATDDPLSATDSLIACSALRDDLVNVADGPAHPAWRTAPLPTARDCTGTWRLDFAAAACRSVSWR